MTRQLSRDSLIAAGFLRRGLRPGLLAAPGEGHQRYRDRPARGPWLVCGPRHLGVESRDRSRGSPERPVHGLRLADGAALRRRLHGLGARGLDSPPAVARASCSPSAAWGMLRLLDAIVGSVPGRGPRRGSCALRPGIPTSTVFLGTDQRDVGRLRRAALAAAGWFLRGVRAVSRGRAVGATGRAGGGVAAFALVLTSAGGGINGAVVGWMLVGPPADARLRDRCARAVALARLGGDFWCGWLWSEGAGLAVVDRSAGEFTPASATTSSNSPSSPTRSGLPTARPEVLRLYAYWTTPTWEWASPGPDHLCSPKPPRCCSIRWWSAPLCSLPALAAAGFARRETPSLCPPSSCSCWRPAR